MQLNVRRTLWIHFFLHRISWNEKEEKAKSIEILKMSESFDNRERSMKINGIPYQYDNNLEKQR